jgi:lipoate-protein ligase A
MAVDEALFRSAEEGLSPRTDALRPRTDAVRPPTLRFYTWSPLCVSLGRLQKADVVDVTWLRDRGLDVVRRPTGGRALLHDQEITYSVAAPVEACPLGPDVMSTYRWVSSGLIAGLARLGVVAGLARRPGGASQRPDRGSPSCLTSAARCDLVVDGRKLVGSAQARGSRAFLQHGALPLTLERQLLREVLGPAGDPGDRATDLAALVGGLGPDEVIEALRRGFEEALGVSLCLGALTLGERGTASRLTATKYDHVW